MEYNKFMDAVKCIIQKHLIFQMKKTRMIKQVLSNIM